MDTRDSASDRRLLLAGLGLFAIPGFGPILAAGPHYAPIRAAKSCVGCHAEAAQKKGLPPPQENDLIALLRIRMPTQPIEEGVHWNWALLMTTA